MMNMDNTTPTYNNRDVEISQANDEIDLKEIITQLWNRRKFIIITTIIFALIGLFVAMTSPIKYSANTTVVPQVGEKSGGNLGGLASMMGVNLGAMNSGEALSPDVYPQIVNSAPFCKDIMQTPIIVSKSNGKPITLYEYYTEPQYQQKSILNGIKRYTIGLPGLIIGSLRGNNKTNTSNVYNDTITNQVISLTEDEKKVMDVIKANTSFNLNPKEGYITMGYTFGEPEATAAITQNIYNVLERYLKDYKTQKQLDNLTFVEQNFEEARQDFIRKQAMLAEFQDTNQGLATATARTIERRLSSEYDIAFTVYNEMAKQREQAKLAVKKSTPVLTVIDPVVVPQKKSAPKRAMILAVFLFLGIIVSVGWVLVKPFIDDIRKSINTNQAEKEDIFTEQ